MIGYLQGKVLDHQDGRMLVGVGATGAMVGYSVVVPQSSAYVGFVPGTMVELNVYTHVREDALDLYGFASKKEKDLFLILLSVNGIGPKGAMGIVSSINPDELIDAVISGDKQALVKVPGIGKKTAERVVLELADPLRKKVEAGLFAGVAGRGAQIEAGNAFSGDVRKDNDRIILREAREALVGLGYREQEINALLNNAFEGEDRPKRVEDLIKIVLQRSMPRTGIRGEA